MCRPQRLAGWFCRATANPGGLSFFGWFFQGILKNCRGLGLFCLALEPLVISSRRWLIAVVSVASWLTGHQSLHAHDCLSDTLADELLADRFGLVREWIIQVPFESTTYRLEHVVVADGIVIAQSGDGGIHAVRTTAAHASTEAHDDPHAAHSHRPGTLLWSHRIGKPGGPVEAAGVGATLVAVARDLDLYGLERSTGETRWHDQFHHIPVAGAMPSGNWVYAPLDAGGVMRLPVDPHRHLTVQSTAQAPAQAKNTKRKPAKAAQKKVADKQAEESLAPIAMNSGGHIDLAPVALADGIIWCTTDGLLVAIEPTSIGWERSELVLKHAPAGPPLVRGTSIYTTTVSGDGGELKRIDLLKTGGSGLHLQWHASLAGPPDPGIFLSGDTLVVSLGERGIAAYTAQHGGFVWQTAVAGKILAVSSNRVWCIDRTGKLSGMDLIDGSRRERISLGGLSLPVINTTSDSLILASADGLLVSLTPRRAPPAVKTPPPSPAKKK